MNEKVSLEIKGFDAVLSDGRSIPATPEMIGNWVYALPTTQWLDVMGKGLADRVNADEHAQVVRLLAQEVNRNSELRAINKTLMLQVQFETMFTAAEHAVGLVRAGVSKLIRRK